MNARFFGVSGLRRIGGYIYVLDVALWRSASTTTPLAFTQTTLTMTPGTAAILAPVQILPDPENTAVVHVQDGSDNSIYRCTGFGTTNSLACARVLDGCALNMTGQRFVLGVSATQLILRSSSSFLFTLARTSDTTASTVLLPLGSGSSFYTS